MPTKERRLKEKRTAEETATTLAFRALLTPEELNAWDILEAREAAARRTFAKKDLKLYESERATGHLNTVQKLKAEIEEAVAERVLEAQKQTVLDTTRAQFPESCFSVVGPEREAVITELQKAVYALSEDGHETDSARAYLKQAIDDLKSAIASEHESEGVQEQADDEAQENANFVAGERAAKEIYDKVNARLSQPMTLSYRKALQVKCLEWAKEARAFIKTPEADTLDAITGARKGAVALRVAEVWDELAKRLLIFGREYPRYSLDNPPGEDAMEDLRDFYYTLGCSPENWVFRLGPKGQLTEESCLLRAAVGRFYARHGYDIDDLPINVPQPTFYPSSWGRNLEGAISQESMKREYDARRQFEYPRERNYEVEKFVRLTPAKLDRLAEKNPDEYQRLLKLARTPAQQDDFVTVYRVPTATIEQPQLQPILYWPFGQIVAVGTEVVYCRPLRCYVLPPEIAADPFFGVPSQMEAEQDLTGHYVWKQTRVESSRRWQMDTDAVTGKRTFHPVSGSAPTTLEESPTRVEIVDADHIPEKDDMRHPDNGGAFRLGNFYSKAEIDEAEQKTSFVLPPVYRTEQPTRLDKPDVPVRSSSVWLKHEQKIQKQQDLN